MKQGLKEYLSELIYSRVDFYIAELIGFGVGGLFMYVSLKWGW